MKITKVEIECTQEEMDKIQYLRITPVDWIGEDAKSHLFNPSKVDFKITRPPLKLYEGMDCSKLQLRGGGVVLCVANNPRSRDYAYLALTRGTFGLTQIGRAVV